MSRTILQVSVSVIRIARVPSDEWEIEGSWDVVDAETLQSGTPHEQRREQQLYRDSLKRDEVTAEIVEICIGFAQVAGASIMELTVSGWYFDDRLSDATEARLKTELASAIRERNPELTVYVGGRSPDQYNEWEEHREEWVRRNPHLQ